MRYIADLHIHSRFSRATSNKLNLSNLEKYAKIKGVDLLGTGDFMHPKWQEELKQELKDDGAGIYRTKSGFPFILSNEISLIYKQDGKGRRVHIVLLAPNMEVVDKITAYFKSIGRIDYDGRPIFGKSAIEVTKTLKQISDDIEIIPAHIWTPWFGLLGSKSGFNSFEEAFGDQVKHIYSYETGLSSDPEMCWRISSMDKFTLLSFSDLHSFWPWRIGREATIFDLQHLTYKDLIKAIRTREGYAGTIEVDPAYGKYHWDGHRNCGVVLSPDETRKCNGICPKCGKPLIVGVEYRVEELADRPQGYRPIGAKPFHKLIPLSELISSVNKVGVATQKTWKIYNKLLEKFGSEYNILLNVKQEELAQVCDKQLAAFIIKNRSGDIKVKPGYDGVYGEAIFDDTKELETNKQDKKLDESNGFTKPQKSLVDF
jgi:uncharacterized protein (TIGR00375 family)